MKEYMAHYNLDAPILDILFLDPINSIFPSNFSAKAASAQWQNGGREEGPAQTK